MESRKPIRVLIVDDSAIVRSILSECLSAENDIEVVGTAPDPYVAARKIDALKPDVVTLDIEMPRMDGITFLQRLVQHRPTPVIVVSSLAEKSCAVALEAIRLGAVDVVAKPGGPFSVGDLSAVLPDKVRAAATVRVVAQAPEASKRLDSISHFPATRIVAIGASTGGTEAIRVVLEQFPANSPGILITQHIPAGFSTAFANRLAKLSAVRVREAQDGDTLEMGLALLAPGNRHMTVRHCNHGYRVNVSMGPKVRYQRPSVDVLFSSVAEAAGDHAAAALLTGMGDDGAQGLLKIRNTGGFTIAQDEESCVVFGMPREAIRLGAAERILPLKQIAETLLRASASERTNGTLKEKYV